MMSQLLQKLHASMRGGLRLRKRARARARLRRPIRLTKQNALMKYQYLLPQ